MARGQRKQDKKQDGPAAADAPVETQVEEAAETRYPISVYMENAAALLGTTKYALAGALVGKTEPEGGYTASELKALVADFSNRPLT